MVWTAFPTFAIFKMGEDTNAKIIKADSPQILRPTHFLR